MPGWYIHLEAARQSAMRLTETDGQIPGFTLTDAERVELFEAAHRWRNYLAVGALGPDLFFLLPDFRGQQGLTVLEMSDLAMRFYKFVDDNLLSIYERWVTPFADNAGLIASNLTGGVSQRLGEALSTFSAALLTWVEGELITQFDAFSLLGSGTQAGVDDNTFFWSDMFHYRKTYEFARALLQGAKDESDTERRQKLLAFALGWISHCATDVTGHAFTNAKCGGPYRLHWQRHHLIENHMDSDVYAARGGWVPATPAGPRYDTMDTSALHLWLAFRAQSMAGYSYTDRDTADGPCNDYFPAEVADATGKPPAYGTDNSLASRRQRHAIYDVDSNPLPEHLCEFLLDTMQEVYVTPDPSGRRSPQILRQSPDPSLHRGDTGLPSVRAMQNTFQFVYELLKANTSAGHNPPPPRPPGILIDTSPPSFPFVDYANNPGAGDPENSFDIWDAILLLLLWPLYLAEVAIWALSILPGLIIGGLTLPARTAIYYALEVPAWSAYMNARRLLVDTGFIYPMPGEIRRGLVELGTGMTRGGGDALSRLLGAPNPDTVTFPPEPSGRSRTNPSPQGFSADPAFPRAEVRDQLFPLPGIDPQGVWTDVFPLVPSAYRKPWAYPSATAKGLPNGFEAPLGHPGPHRQGERPAVLLPPWVSPTPVDRGDANARRAFEQASSPEETAAACAEHLPSGRTLGNPIDYGIYLLSRMWPPTLSSPLPDFNLDSDRGYAQRCWDYVRRAPLRPPDDQWVNVPVQQQPLNPPRFSYDEPVTPPVGYNPDDSVRPIPGPTHPLAPRRHRSPYDPMHRLWTVYRGVPGAHEESSAETDPDLDVSDATMRQAGMSPKGRPTP